MLNNRSLNRAHQKAKPRIISQMAELNDYKNAVFQLQSVWDNLALLAQLSGTGTDMSQTRSAFTQVTQNVLDNLATEMLNKTVSALSSKAFVIINIVIRNLFERTADIGFLSSDDEIRHFLTQYTDEHSTSHDVTAMVKRFEEYVAKYTVYDNVILLDPAGNVITQLDGSNQVTRSNDPLINEALTTDLPYVEIYRYSDLAPNKANSLIYAHRVTSSKNKVLGVLCLCFRFESEMALVFQNLITSHDWAVGVMLNQAQEVIASSDPHQIPLGASLEVTPKGVDWQLTRFGGREYIAVTKQTTSYQGYRGPGWMGHAMIPLAHAFENDHEEEFDRIDHDLLAKVMRSPLIFSQSLLDIPKNAANIQSKLNQSVWNGNIWQINDAKAKQLTSNQSTFSKSLLWEISNTGFKTQHIIEKTVVELYQTVVATLLEKSRFSAFLAADIMDRNLYERANDCRWWARHLSFRTILAQNTITPKEQSQLTDTLRHINQLYTVYDNLVLFDRAGQVLAVSNPNAQSSIGSLIAEEWFARLRSLSNDQRYLVSKFEPSPFYEHKPTYIYVAAIRAPNQDQIVGGIGIVFDSLAQFTAILQDASPLDDQGLPIAGSFNLLVDHDLQVIASTHPEIAIGSSFAIEPRLCRLNPGESKFDIVQYQHQYFAVGAYAASGYREFNSAKSHYRHAITAMIFIPLGSIKQIDALIKADNNVQHNAFKTSSTHLGLADTVEYATFYVENDWLGLPVTEVSEAIETQHIRSIPESDDIYTGLIQYHDIVIPVFNLAKALKKDSVIKKTHQQIIVLKATNESPPFGILISALGEIPNIDPTKIEPSTNLFSGNGLKIAEGITAISVDASKSNMLTILSTANLWHKLSPKAL